MHERMDRITLPSDAQRSKSFLQRMACTGFVQSKMSPSKLIQVTTHLKYKKHAFFNSIQLQGAIRVRGVFVEEIDGEKRYERANKMNGWDINESINPPHADGTTSKREGLQQKEYEEHGCPIAFATLLQPSRFIPVV